MSFLIEALTSQGGVNLQVPRDESPAEEWLTFQSIVRDLELRNAIGTGRLLLPVPGSLGKVMVADPTRK